MTHIAKAPFVKVSVGDPAGHSVARIIRAGGVIPDGVDDAILTSLVERGLIEKVADGEGGEGGTGDDSGKKTPPKRKTAAEKKAEAEAAEKARLEAEASAAADTK